MSVYVVVTAPATDIECYFLDSRIAHDSLRDERHVATRVNRGNVQRGVLHVFCVRFAAQNTSSRKEVQYLDTEAPDVAPNVYDVLYIWVTPVDSPDTVLVVFDDGLFVSVCTDP